MDYCTAGPQYASGGFIADSRFGAVVNGSQQQWLTRNSVVGSWSNAVWNQVFAGVEGAPDDATFPDPPYTTLATTPVSREKPYLVVDARGRYQVRVPSATTDSSGSSWADGPTPGKYRVSVTEAMDRPEEDKLNNFTLQPKTKPSKMVIGGPLDAEVAAGKPNSFTFDFKKVDVSKRSKGQAR